MTKRFSIIGVLALVLSTWILPSQAAENQSRKQPKGSSAYARFVINPTGARETDVIVDVKEAAAGTQIDFQYFVTSTSEEGDFLMYHAITGSASISDDDFTVLGDGRIAVLDTLIPVFDDEGGTEFEMGVQVIWLATGPAKKGTRRVVAAVNVFTPFGSPYITDFIFPSDTASITQSK